MAKIKFICPKCGGTKVEQKLVGVIEYSIVDDVEMDSYVETGKSEMVYEGSMIDGYFCRDCEYKLMDNGAPLTFGYELYDWLNERGMLGE